MPTGAWGWLRPFGITAEHEQFVAANPPAITGGTLAGRTVLERRVLQMEDAFADPEYTCTESAQRRHFRTQLGVPLIREGELIGALCFARSRVELFTEKQIALIATFADQAVIAMENARLITELRDRTRDLQESLEYQTATADLLKIVSRSTFDLQPVLENLAESATRLCEADFGIIHRQQGEAYRLVASHQLPQAAKASLEGHPLRPGRGSTTGRALFTGQVTHIEDIATDPDYEFPQASRYIAYGTTLAVPLLRGMCRPASSRWCGTW